MTLVIKSFCAQERIFPVKRWDHSSNRELLLYSNMFYSEMTSCYWKTLLPSSAKVTWSQKQPESRESVWLCKTATFWVLNERKSPKLQFSSLCFWWFSPNFCELETLSHVLYPPTHTHTSYELPTWTGTTWTHMPGSPSENLRCAVWKFSNCFTPPHLLSVLHLHLSFHLSIHPSIHPSPLLLCEVLAWEYLLGIKTCGKFLHGLLVPLRLVNTEGS